MTKLIASCLKANKEILIMRGRPLRMCSLEYGGWSRRCGAPARTDEEVEYSREGESRRKGSGVNYVSIKITLNYSKDKITSLLWQPSTKHRCLEAEVILAQRIRFT